MDRPHEMMESLVREIALMVALEGECMVSHWQQAAFM